MIKTWNERCEEHPDHQTGMISERMIQARMQDEIDDLRTALEQEQEPVAWGAPDAEENIVETISPEEKITDMKAWADQYSVPLYTRPPQRKPLSEAEVCALIIQDYCMEEYYVSAIELIRRVEQAHGIKEQP
jgi:hypothetical protein